MARTHASVAQLSSTDFAAMIARGEPLAIFDARSDTEYRVSRIPGAARIAPDIAADRFIREHGAAVSGKAVVFYCSVGVRSSKLAERLSPALRERDALAVYNLAGGIFRWHNEGRALANDAGVTPFVHPFDKTWGKLLLRPELARYAPG